MKKYICTFLILFSAISTEAQTSFLSAMDKYFTTGDLTQAKMYVGRMVENGDMKDVDKKYPGSGLLIAKSKPYLGVAINSMNSKVIAFSLTSIIVNGKNNYEIWDVKGIELKPGYTVYTGRLMTQSLNFPNGNTEIPEAIGLLMIKVGERVPVEKRLVPDWIITADKEGKLMISVPKDKSKYLYMQGG